MIFTPASALQEVTPSSEVDLIPSASMMVFCRGMEGDSTEVNFICGPSGVGFGFGKAPKSAF